MTDCQKCQSWLSNLKTLRVCFLFVCWGGGLGGVAFSWLYGIWCEHILLLFISTVIYLCIMVCFVLLSSISLIYFLFQAFLFNVNKRENNTKKNTPKQNAYKRWLWYLISNRAYYMYNNNIMADIPKTI